MVLWYPLVPSRPSLTGLSPSLAGLPRTVLLDFFSLIADPNPDMHAYRFGLLLVRSPLLQESLLFSLPPAT